jgi:uncharacterized protein
MTPAERQLIEDLFDRMQRLGPVEKDRDAERLIQEALREIPDAPYYLVQSVLVQEDALAKASARIKELETGSVDAPPRSFLGGSSLNHGSVPTAGARPVAPPPYEPPQPQAGRGGGFLASALSTAAGVTGGMLLADSIRGLFGGHSGAAASPFDQAALDKAQDEAQDASDDADEAHKELAKDDAALDDMQDQYEDGGDDWGGGDGGIDT